MLAPSPGTELELHWESPPQCPRAEAVRAAIDANLGEGAFDADPSSIVARGTITAEAGGWQLDVEVSLPSGRVERRVVGRTCEDFASAAGLMIAVALDPLRVTSTIAEPPAVAPAVVPQADEAERPELAARTKPAAPTHRERALAIEPRLGGVLEIGSLDRLRGGVAASVGFVGPLWRVDLVAHYWAPRAVKEFATAPDAGVSVQQVGGGARACVRPRAGPVELPTCVGFEAGASIARGIGLAESEDSVLPWAAVVMGQELTWVSRRRVGLFVGVDAMLHVVRPRFRVEDLGIAAETGWAGVRFVFGPLVRI